MENIFQLINSDQKLLEIDVVDFFNPQTHSTKKTIPNSNFDSNEVELLKKNILESNLLSKLENIVYLDLSSLKIEEYPNLNTLKHLIELHHIGGKFNLPDSICECQTLIKIWISCVILNKLPKNFSNLSNLESFTIERSTMKKLPKEVTSLFKLNHLNFQQNKIEKLPDDISNLQELQVLQMSENKISELPLGFYQLKNLEELDLSYNPIFYLDKSNVEWGKIKKINLSNTPFGCFEKNINFLRQKFPNCEVLGGSNNRYYENGDNYFYLSSIKRRLNHDDFKE
jgi:Leucine-rich repeat (LRR) protein